MPYGFSASMLCCSSDLHMPTTAHYCTQPLSFPHLLQESDCSISTELYWASAFSALHMVFTKKKFISLNSSKSSCASCPWKGVNSGSCTGLCHSPVLKPLRFYSQVPSLTYVSLECCSRSWDTALPIQQWSWTIALHIPEVFLQPAAIGKTMSPLIGRCLWMCRIQSQTVQELFNGTTLCTSPATDDSGEKEMGHGKSDWGQNSVLKVSKSPNSY